MPPAPLTTSGWFFSLSLWTHRLSCAALRLLANLSRSCVDSDASGISGVGGGDGGGTKLTMGALRVVMADMSTLESEMEMLMLAYLDHIGGIRS